MFGLVRKKTIRKAMNEIKAANRREQMGAKYPARTEEQIALNLYATGYENGTDNFYNALLYKLAMKRNL